MTTLFKYAGAGLLSAMLLAACSGNQPGNQPVTEQPSANATTDVVEVTHLGDEYHVHASNPADELLWTAHHPVGQGVEVQAFNTAESVHLTVMNGHAYQGDDIVGDVRGQQVIGLDGQVIATLDGSDVIQKLGFGINRAVDKWPGGVVPYVYDASATANIRSQFEQAVGMYTAQTGVRFVARTNQANYVRVKADSGCYSYVGMMSTYFKPNGQEIGLGTDGCGVGGALHEMGHAAGLEHEQNRADRDQFINIRFDLIPTDWQSQYRLNLDPNRTSYTPYDFKSIMHYRNYQVNGQWQMTDKSGKTPPQDIGNGGNVLTEGDKTSVNTIYGKTGGGTPTPTGGTGIGLPLGNWVSFQVTNAGLTNRYLRHQNSVAFTEAVDGANSITLKQDATFRIVRAVDGTPCYSFESRNFAGSFLRHAAGRLRIDKNDNTDLFRRDATFCAQSGLTGAGGVALASRNYPNSYIRHRNAEVWLDANDGSAAFKQDATWTLASPWAP